MSIKCKRMRNIDDIEICTKRLKVHDDTLLSNNYIIILHNIQTKLCNYIDISTKTFDSINKTLVTMNKKIDNLEKNLTQIQSYVKPSLIDHTNEYIS